MLAKIVSGGQTGVDRAALDAALAAAIELGGWCPRGRRAEDGRIPDRYPLVETPGADHAQRTEWNVRDSDATLILVRGALEGGTALTAELARALGRPLRIVRLDEPHVADDPGSATDAAAVWIARHGIATLNVAGPRKSQRPGIGREAREFVGRLIAAAGRDDSA